MTDRARYEKREFQITCPLIEMVASARSPTAFSNEPFKLAVFLKATSNFYLFTQIAAFSHSIHQQEKIFSICLTRF